MLMFFFHHYPWISVVSGKTHIYFTHESKLSCYDKGESLLKKNMVNTIFYAFTARALILKYLTGSLAVHSNYLDRCGSQNAIDLIPSRGQDAACGRTHGRCFPRLTNPSSRCRWYRARCRCVERVPLIGMAGRSCRSIACAERGSLPPATWGERRITARRLTLCSRR